MKLFLSALMTALLVGWLLVSQQSQSNQMNNLHRLTEILNEGSPLHSDLESIGFSTPRSRLLVEYNWKEIELCNTMVEGTWTAPSVIFSVSQSIVPFDFFEN